MSVRLEGRGAELGVRRTQEASRGRCPQQKPQVLLAGPGGLRDGRGEGTQAGGVSPTHLLIMETKGSCWGQGPCHPAQSVGDKEREEHL